MLRVYDGCFRRVYVRLVGGLDSQAVKKCVVGVQSTSGFGEVKEITLKEVEGEL